MDHLVKPYGGRLQDLLVGDERAAQLRKDSQGYPVVTLTQRQLCDMELLMNGAFSPLRGFMTREVYESVLEKMRLPVEQESNISTPSPSTGEGGGGGDRHRGKGSAINQGSAHGLLWPIPITLDVPDTVAEKLEAGGWLGLNDPEGFMLAILRVGGKWKPDKRREAQLVYGMESLNHPGVRFFVRTGARKLRGGRHRRHPVADAF